MSTIQNDSGFVRESRYLVVKIKDANAYLSADERDTLERICAKVHFGRIDNGKNVFECVVVEKDWPEYEDTWRAIEARVTGDISGTYLFGADDEVFIGVPMRWMKCPAGLVGSRISKEARESERVRREGRILR